MSDPDLLLNKIIPKNRREGKKADMADILKKDWLTTGTTIVSAILVFRVVYVLGEVAWFFLQTIPYSVVGSLAELDFLIIPAVSVALAVMLSRWHEGRFANASLATRMIVFLAITVFAFFPVQLRMSFAPVAVHKSQESPEGELVGTGIVPKKDRVIRGTIDSERNMRKIKYTRYEFQGDPEDREVALHHLVYDIPYLGACGIFPPLHILNEIFNSGGSDGGMSPGATWQPFTITKEEYDELIGAVSNLDIEEIRNVVRYAHIPFDFDSAFDNIHDRFEWMQKVCEQHQDSWHKRLGTIEALNSAGKEWDTPKGTE